MFREKNPNWRGGRTITQHGYVLLRVGTGHHLADIRGYAYEHRVVAEQVLGRGLKPDEKAHHIDEDRQNNSPGNILVVNGNHGHYVHHRKNNTLRFPGELNPTIRCGCGCRGKFKKYDAQGRPRKYISGHNGRKSNEK